LCDARFSRGDFMLRQILNEFLSIEGVTTAALIGHDGFVIEVMQTEPADPDTLGALCSSSMRFFEREGGVLCMGKPRQIALEYQAGTLILTPITDEEFLAVLTNTAAGLGRLSYTLPKIRSRIQAVI
jgi:uncharacterized protein